MWTGDFETWNEEFEQVEVRQWPMQSFFLPKGSWDALNRQVFPSLSKCTNARLKLWLTEKVWNASLQNLFQPTEWFLGPYYICSPPCSNHINFRGKKRRRKKINLFDPIWHIVSSNWGTATVHQNFKWSKILLQQVNGGGMGCRGHLRCDWLIVD